MQLRFPCVFGDGVRLVFEFRVKKYDPAHRDRRGAYTQDVWTSIGDVGCVFGGGTLTETEYQRFEDAYINVAVDFLCEAARRR